VQHRTLLLLFVLLLGHASAVSGQEVSDDPRAQDGPLTIDGVARLAVREDPLLVRLQRAVDDARDELGWAGVADDLAISVGGSLQGADFSQIESAGNVSLTAGLNLLPQLTITGSLGANYNDPETDQAPPPLTASVGLALLPFADAQGRSRDEVALARAQADLAARAREASYGAIDALLAAVEARSRATLAEHERNVAAARYESVSALAARDRATDDEVASARDESRVARQAVDRRRLEADERLWVLARTTGLPLDDLELPGWMELELDSRIDEARKDARTLQADALVAASHGVVGARLALESARIEASATRAFTPRLTANAGLSLPGPGYSLGLSVSARLSDWDALANERSDEDVVLAARALESAVRSAEYAFRAARLELSFAHEELEAALRDLQRAEQSLAETEFRFNRGDVAPLTVSQAELTVERARLRTQIRRAGVIRAWYAIDLLHF
jgi:outer membrane protein TolC